MKQVKKWGALALCLALVLALAAGCSGGESASTATPAPAPSETASAAPAPTPSPEPAPEESADARPEVNLGLLNGPTGMGAAKLLADNDAGATAAKYNVTMGSDPATDIVPRVINGELDLAAVPTNLAATLYAKTEGGVKLLALNTLGVLHILENGDTVHSLADLAGRTVCATGQGANPEYVLNYLLELNGLTPGEDVTIEWKASEEVTALMVTGEADLAMLPVPAATSVMMQNEDVRDAVDLNDAWTEAGASGTFTMGCLIANAGWVEENPELVDAILAEYAASIDYVKENVEEASQLIAQYGITPKAAIAAAAIPQANLVCVTGADLREIQDYYEVLFAADPTSIGGAIPDDAFYYIP